MINKNMLQIKPILSPKERRQRNREEIRSMILATALEIIRQDGAGALNLNELARRVQMRPSSIYVYFSGKMAIYDALFEMGVALYREEIQKVSETVTDPWQIVDAVLTKYMELAIENPELFQIVLERPVPGFEPSEQSMIEAEKMTTELYMLLNRVMPADAKEPHRNIPQAHGLMIAMMHGLTALHMANDPHLPLGSGRFSSLIPAAVALFKTAWGKEEPHPSYPV